MTDDTRALCDELLVLAEESISYRAQVDEAVNLDELKPIEIARHYVPTNCSFCGPAEESISYRAQVDEAVNLIDRARALLAQSEPASAWTEARSWWRE